MPHTQRYHERHGARFLDDVQEELPAFAPRHSAQDRDEVIVALTHEGGDLSALRETWDFDVGDVRASPQVVYIDVTVNGRQED